MIDFANYMGAHFIKHDNPRVSCPPGRFVCQEGPLVIVATIMRAGTHLMIDALLNNFDALRSNPLYINLDELLRTPDAATQVSQLKATGGYVVKTHYPQIESRFLESRDQCVRQIAARARIITIRRDPSDTFRSTQSWLRDGESARKPSNMHTMKSARDWETYQAALAQFDAFWADFPVFSIDFRRLTNPDELPTVLDEISDWIGLPHRLAVVPSLPKQAKKRVYLAKALTRMLGHRAPRINTTIRFAKS